MQIVSYPCLIMASIVFYAGFYHLFMFIKRQESIEHLPFSLICFSVGFYDIFSFGLYNSAGIEQGIFWQKLQLGTADFISIFLIWFVFQYTRQSRKIILYSIISWFALILILSFLISDDYTLSVQNQSIKHIYLSELLKVTYYESELGVLYIIGVVSSLLTYSYLLFLLISYYKKTRYKNVLFMIIGQIAYFAGVINDFFVASGIYPFIYVSEYSFLIIVASMAYALLSEFVDLHKSIEHLNKNLEKIVEDRTSEIQGLIEDLRHQVDMDSLTGIYNRRFFNEYLEIETRRAKNQMDHSTPSLSMTNDMNFGLAILDIDNFKQINDMHGHLAGDSVLVSIVKIISGNIFSRDIFCRYGGEEFVIIFTRTSREGIIQAAEKIRESVAVHEFLFEKAGSAEHITVSIGVAFFIEVPRMNGSEILKIADARLYQAKNRGKNLVVYKD